MYSHYVRELTKLHIESEQYTEAGLTLLLTASRYSWSDAVIRDDLEPRIEWERKEKEYFEAMKYLDRGQVYSFYRVCSGNEIIFSLYEMGCVWSSSCNDKLLESDNSNRSMV